MARTFSEFMAGKFRAAAAHALHHRHKAALVAEQLLHAVRAGQAAERTGYFTHLHLAHCRGVEFRGTSRAITGELAELGLVKLFVRFRQFERDGRTCTVLVHHVVIMWRRVKEYVDQHALVGLRPYAGTKRPRTALDYDREREAWHRDQDKRKAEAAQRDAAAREAARRADQERRESPEGRRAALAQRIALMTTSRDIARRLGDRTKADALSLQIVQLRGELEELTR